MIVSCPDCSAKFKFPDEKIGEEPKKLRCAKCKKIFTVVRRMSIPPAGFDGFEYEEHTESQASLPSEFAFLTETQDSSPSEIGQSTEQKRPAAPPPPPPMSEKKITDEIQPSTVEEQPSTVEDQSITVPVAVDSIPVAVDQSSVDVDADRPTNPAGAVAQPQSNWRDETPMSLDSYSLDSDNKQTQIVGKIMAGMVVAVVVFFVFVAFRNGWDITLSDLPSQISFAFSGKSFEKLPEEAEKIEVTVNETRTLKGKDGRVFLVVTGEVVNLALTSRTHIMIRGRLVDGNDALRGETTVPCGHVIENAKITETPKGKIDDHYRNNGEVYNCTVKNDRSTIYQIVFEDIPENYDSSFSVEAKVISASYP